MQTVGGDKSMSRVPQQAASRGGQKWLQILINDRPQLINQLLAPRLGLADGDDIRWLSPLNDDDYAEYRDGEFLERLGVILDRRSLNAFWPDGGPQWDALARTDSGKLLLVEAKAYVTELVTYIKENSARKTSRTGRGSLVAL